MSVTEQQLTLDFPCRPALGLEDFFVSSSNDAAIQFIDQWPNWPAPAAYLSGPNGSGKSHLAHVWQISSQAEIYSAADYSGEEVKNFDEGSALVIEDIDETIFDEQALFHLINLGFERGFTILFTGSLPPGQLDITLPDLRSRLRSMPLVTIEQPDDMLLKTMMIKQFHDRQLDVSPQLIDYLIPRMERSFEGVQWLVETLDKEALAAGRRLTRQFAGDVLRLHQR